MQKFEEPGSSCGKLQSAPREGGWHHVSHARPGFWQHDESQSQATPSAIDVTSGWQKKPAQPGGSRNKAVALDLIVVNTALDENTPDVLSLREAIEVSNGTLLFSALSPQQQKQVFLSPNSPSTDIVFNIPASTAPNLDVPVPGFDPATQDWTITLQSLSPRSPIRSRSTATARLKLGFPSDIPPRPACRSRPCRSSATRRGDVQPDRLAFRTVRPPRRRSPGTRPQHRFRRPSNRSSAPAPSP